MARKPRQARQAKLEPVRVQIPAPVPEEGSPITDDELGQMRLRMETSRLMFRRMAGDSAPDPQAYLDMRRLLDAYERQRAHLNALDEELRQLLITNENQRDELAKLQPAQE